MLRNSLRHLAPATFLVLGWTTAAAAAEVELRPTQERTDGYRAEVVIRNPGQRPITDWSLEFAAERAIERAWGAEMTRSGGNRYRFRPDPWTREIAAGGQAKFTIAGPPGEEPLQPSAIDLDARYATAAAEPPSKPAAAAPQPAPRPPQASAPPRPSPPPPAQAREKPRPAQAEEKPRPPARSAPTRRAAPSSPRAVEHTVAFKLQSAWESGFTAEMVVVNGSDRHLKPWRLEFELEGDIVEMWNADFRKVGGDRYAVIPKPYNDEIDPGGFVTFGFKTSTAFHSAPADTRLGAVN